MHLAALSPAAAAISRLLAAKCAPGPAAWFWVAADDGLTPASFAERLGTPERNADMLQRAIAAGASQRVRVSISSLQGLFVSSFMPAGFAERLGTPGRNANMLLSAIAAGAP